MKLLVYPRLSTRSKSAFRKTMVGIYSKRYYVPQHDLMERLKRELGMNETQILEQIEKERAFFIKLQS